MLSISQHLDTFQSILQAEISTNHLFSLFTKWETNLLIGPFQSSPLTLVSKHEAEQFRLIQNLSYPLYATNSITSINSHILSADYPIYYGIFLTIAIIICHLPPGSQASTRDVKDAYCTVPLHLSQWPGTVL